MNIMISIALILSIFLAMSKCGFEPPTECERARDRAIDLELSINPGNYSQAGQNGEYAKTECLLKEKTDQKQTSTSAETINSEKPVEEQKVKKSTSSFGSFRSEAETTKKELQCPNSIDSDITHPLYGVLWKNPQKCSF